MNAFISSITADKARKSVLIVDDDSDFREILATKLQKSGFAIHIAHNGAEGLELARRYAPDLILLDIDMTVMNGVEAFRQLKADPVLRKLKVAFLTNYDEPMTEGPTYANGYIRKGSSPDVIAAYVEGIVLATSGPNSIR